MNFEDFKTKANDKEMSTYYSFKFAKTDVHTRLKKV